MSEHFRIEFVKLIFLDYVWYFLNKSCSELYYIVIIICSEKYRQGNHSPNSLYSYLSSALTVKLQVNKRCYF